MNITDEGQEVLRKGDELANKLIEVLQKELGDEIPCNITLYAAAKFAASILYAVRKQTNDDIIEKGFFYTVKSLLDDESEKPEAESMSNPLREAEQALAELEKDIKVFDREYDDLKRKITENEMRSRVIKQKRDLITKMNDDDMLN